VAREHNLPAYIVFHDATLAEMARSPRRRWTRWRHQRRRRKKLDAYGQEILRVLGRREG
jgi:ATP-dependent DNA helicase RecQ